MKPLTEQQTNAINEVLDNMEWHKIHKTMEALRWTWCFSKEEGDTRVPEQADLIARSRGLLTNLLQNGDLISTSSGGLRASIAGDELALDFILTGSTALYTPSTEATP